MPLTTEEICLEWTKNKIINPDKPLNPITKYTVKKNGKIYKELDKLCSTIKINKIDIKYLDTNLTFRKPLSSSLSSYITDNLYTSEKIDTISNDPNKIKEDLDKYNDLKEQILYINFILTFVGSSILYATNPSEHMDETLTFIYGGITGLLYQLLLQLDIDNVGKQEKLNIILKLFANSAVRLTSIGILFTFYITYSNNNTSNLPLLLFGFWMHKLAVLLYFAKLQK